MTWFGQLCFLLIIFNSSLCICVYIRVFKTGFGLGLKWRKWRALQASFFLCVWLFWKGYRDNHLMALISKRKVALQKRDFQISVPKRNITLATSNNVGPPTLTWSCGPEHAETTLLVVCSVLLVWAKMILII
jgi:hypothetical protein